ncbi:MAG: hypothetical protein FWD44_04295 [Oscillospiraceae bacterium]|nr:hypothetical protein [Oscillospiraceae bacterium]
MEKTQAQLDKEARLAEYNNTYADQLRLLGYIRALEADNENIRDTQVVTNRAKRRARKLIKINDKDIKLYNKMLATMPEVPPFK